MVRDGGRRLATGAVPVSMGLVGLMEVTGIMILGLYINTDINIMGSP